jgi:hypothetical protein
MKKLTTLLFMLSAILLAGSTSWAQDAPRLEFSFSYGWTFSDGVGGETAVLAPDGNIYDGIDPKDSSSWGFTGEYFITPTMEVGFLFNRQKSTLELNGQTTTEIGDMNVDNYDGTFSFNMGSVDSSTRPFFMFGLGATHYGSVDFIFNGVPHTLDGNTKASVTLGGGLKFYPARNIGVRLQARLTPTYINTDEDGWWCDPFYGCYTVGNVQYSNQIDMSGGLIVRF